MNRRNFLKLCNRFGLSAASYPLLHSLPSLAQGIDAGANNGKRFFVVYNPLGFHQPSWTTGVGHRSGDDWQLTDSEVLSPLQPVKEETIVVEGR